MSSVERSAGVGNRVDLLGGIAWLLRAQARSPGRAIGPDAGVEAELRRQLAEREAALASLRAGGAVHGLESGRGRRSGAGVIGSPSPTSRTEEAAAARREAREPRRDRLAAVEVALATGRDRKVEMGRALLEEQRRFHADNERELREKHDAALVELRATNDRALAVIARPVQGAGLRGAERQHA
jgi:hypothetical protein